jgi:hypothetical protein
MMEKLLKCKDGSDEIQLVDLLSEDGKSDGEGGAQETDGDE